MEGRRQKNQERKTIMPPQENELKTFFYPENVAVIGVSPEVTNLGRNIVENLLTFGYRGEILSVGLKKGVIYGQRIYPSLDRIDHRVDLAVILTPAKTIPDILEQCGRNGIKRVVIEAGGFSEMGEEGLPLEASCIAVALKHGIRFIGPNGIGVTNMENGLALPFMPLRKDLSLGPLSILAQSGGVGLSYLGFMAEENIGLNKFVSMGNKLNVNENDLLDYLIDDPGTGMVLLYLEGFSDGRRFLEVASRSHKPILLHKSNRFRASAQIAHSHTAALFADDRLVDHALEQAGCVRVNTLSDAMDYIKILTLPPLKGNRLSVVSRSGGHAVIAADACAHYGFDLPPFPKEFLSKIESRFRAKVIRLQNPLDLGDLFDLGFYVNIVEEMLKREDVDGVLLGHGYRRGFEQEDSRDLIKNVERLVHEYQKPVAVVVFTEAVEMDYLKRHFRIPIFEAPENAMRAFHLSHKWASREVTSFMLPSVEKADRGKVEAVLKQAREREHLFLDESIDLIKAYGFPAPPYGLARTAEEALLAWQGFKGPVVMKVNRPHVSHKTDTGLVRLNLDSERDVREAFDHMQRILGPDPVEVMVQPMVTLGREVILGGKQDRVFGPVVLFGLGGIFVEALGDVTWRVAPIQRHDAEQMIHQIRGWKILTGTRGEAPCDLGELQDLLIRLSRMLVEFPVIQEIDINPVKVQGQGQGSQALDARVILQQK
jgi:acyl-CoA synthetase (NDP forming)